MPVLSNPRHERFVQLLLEGKTAVEAYEQAGYRRDDGNAVRLIKKPAITARIQELTGPFAETAKITAEALIAKNEAVYKRAMEIDQLSAAVAAGREIGVLTGHRIERKEVGPPGAFDAMTDDELERVLIERLKVLGLTPDGERTPDTESDTRH